MPVFHGSGGAVHNRGLICLKNILIKTASQFVSPAYHLLFFSLCLKGKKVFFLLLFKHRPLKIGFKNV